MAEVAVSIPREGRQYRFTEPFEYRGWTFAAGDVVTLVDSHVPYLDWFQHMVQTEAGEFRRIGAGVLALHTEEIE